MIIRSISTSHPFKHIDNTSMKQHFMAGPLSSGNVIELTAILHDELGPGVRVTCAKKPPQFVPITSIVVVEYEEDPPQEGTRKPAAVADLGLRAAQSGSKK